MFIGSLLFAIAYAFICRIWYLSANISEMFAIPAVFPATFLQGPPLRSVSELLELLYESLKYLIILLVMGLIIQIFVKNRGQQVN